ncbi:putative toxin-antitoxin system toxin component, PIN family [Candidatus Bipolaricaulota bacterium]|nr:putative toxin-antitoxin system toxin component, PIN family [Candidatus Bipolaricaulota bacterium]
MRVVADTNIVVSGLLWHGLPRQILDAARDNVITIFSSISLLAELEEVLQREKFASRLALAGIEARELVLGYAALSTLVEPESIEPVVLADPDDDVVLACAVAAEAEAVVSGDNHLLELNSYREIPILGAAGLLARIAAS